MRLYHISEDGNIRNFKPRESIEMWNNEYYVWAISEGYYHNYLFPRDCPRICVQQSDLPWIIDRIDLELDYVPTALILIPSSWRNSIENTTLFLYEFSPTNFICMDASAGYYVSKQEEQPISKTKIQDSQVLLESLNTAVVMKEIRELERIKDLVVNNCEHFSVIRWNKLY